MTEPKVTLESANAKWKYMMAVGMLAEFFIAVEAEASTQIQAGVPVVVARDNVYRNLRSAVLHCRSFITPWEPAFALSACGAIIESLHYEMPLLSGPALDVALRLRSAFCEATVGLRETGSIDPERPNTYSRIAIEPTRNKTETDAAMQTLASSLPWTVGGLSLGHVCRRAWRDRTSLLDDRLSRGVVRQLVEAAKPLPDMSTPI